MCCCSALMRSSTCAPFACVSCALPGDHGCTTQTPMQLQLQPRALPAALRDRGHLAKTQFRAAFHTQRRPCTHLHTGQCQGRRQHMAVSHEHSLVHLAGRLLCSSHSSTVGASVQDVKGLQEGSVVTGLVTGTASFGAFLDINGVKGLVHISQIREGKVKNVAKELSVGQEVTARVLMVEPDTGRVRLSMKALEKTKPRVDRVKDNDSVPEHMQVGTVITGVVTHLNKSSAWVDIEGVKALLHVSQLKEGYVDYIEEELSIGQEVTARVIKVQPSIGRVELSMRAPQEVKEGAGSALQVQVGDLVTGVVTRLSRTAAYLDIGGTMGRLDVRQISRTWVDLDNVLSVGEQLQVLVHKIYPHRDLVLVSTSVLERNQGDMLTNRQAVWDGAEEMAVQWRAQQEVKQAKLASKRQRRGGRVEAVLAAVKEGDLVTGVVESIRIYGAFVKVGSIKCLLHKSNIGQDEVTDIADHLSKRQKITARVVTVNEENVRVSLSIKPEHLAS